MAAQNHRWRRRLPIALTIAMLGVGVAVWHREEHRKNARPIGTAVMRGESRPVRAGARSALPAAAIADALRERFGANEGEFERRVWRDCFPDADRPIETWSDEHPTAVTVAPYADIPLTFVQTKVTRDGAITTWVGRNPELPGATLVGVARPGGYDAVLLVPGASQFFFHVRDGVALVEESVARGTDCGVGELPPRPAPLAAASGTHYAEAAEEAIAAFDPAETVHEANAPRVSEVLFLYNTGALSVAQQRSSDPIGYIDGYSRSSLETCNQALVNSRVTEFSWRFLGLAPAPAYPAKTTVGQEVNVMVDDGPLATFVGQIRRAYGADQVLMWLGTGERKGAAYMGDETGQPAKFDYAVAVLRITAPVLILGHELGHNFGLHHDRGHAGSGGGDAAQPDGDGKWAYGLLWVDNEGSTVGTVMAYADWLVPYYSNPTITLDVTSTLVGRSGSPRSLGTKTIGFPETHPSAAHNTRVLNDSAAHMTALGAEDETAPQFWLQPDDGNFASGAQMILTASASGRNLTYQWSRNGTAIAGATSFSFAKAFAASDEGDYSVTVTNSRGSATSRTAAIRAVQVTTPTTPIAPVNSGGGGGGSPSVWFGVAAAIVCALRRRGLKSC